MFIAFHEDVSQTTGKFSFCAAETPGSRSKKEDGQKHTVRFSCHVTEQQE